MMAALALSMVGCAGDVGLTPDAEAEAEQREAAEAAAPANAVPYRTEIEGVEDSDLKTLLERSSQLVALQDKPPVSRVRLVRRIEEDLERFRTVLRSEGYYAAEVGHRIGSGEQTLPVTITVATGPRYELRSFEIVYQPPISDPELPRTMVDAGLRAGDPARSRAVVDAKERVLKKLGTVARPFAKEADQKAVVNHAERSMAVTLTIDPGPKALFGPVTFSGLETVEEAYLRRQIRWDEGAPYDQTKIDAFATRLRESNLFETATVRPSAPADDEGKAPLTVELKERKHRSIGAGVNYSSSEGFGAEAFWEHRNLLGEGETMRVSAIGAEIRQELTLDFRKPNYKRLDQALLTKTTAIHQDTEAFEELGGSQFVGLERKLSDVWKVTLGGLTEYTQITDNDGNRDFLLLGVPGSARRDDTDDLLDPTKGTRVQLKLTPYYSFFDVNGPFLVSELTGSGYIPVLSKGRFVVAGRARLGSIVGFETDDIPASKRFYSGGGGSIRGYEFQKVGPLDGEGEPLGGRSVFEVGLDLRFRVTDEIGLVPFVEAGNVFDDSVPDFRQDLQVAAGLGVRYYTGIGPVRLDVAFPVNGREGIDDVFQFYISLGQAF